MSTGAGAVATAGGRLAAMHSLAWLVVASAAGAGMAAVLVWPAAGDALAPLTYGRWAPLHLNGQLYGWGALPLVGALLAWFLDPAHPGAERHAALALGAWSLALALGGAAWLGGYTSGKLFLDWHGWTRPLLPAAMHLLWAFLAAHTWWRRRALAPGALAARAVVLTILLAVPSVLHWAAGREVRPAVNPDSGGATGAALLGSTLALITVLGALPAWLGLPRGVGPDRRARRWLPLAVSWAVFLGIDHGDTSHHALAQMAALAVLLAWIPLLPLAWRAHAWPAAAGPWLRAAVWWWALLVASGWVGFLPGLSERLKFTQALVGHAHLAMAGFLSSVNGAVLAVLTGRAAAPGVFAAWQGGTAAFVVVMFALAAHEHRDPHGFLHGDAVTAVLLALRLAAGLVMLAAAVRWLAGEVRR